MTLLLTSANSAHNNTEIIKTSNVYNSDIAKVHRHH